MGETTAETTTTDTTTTETTTTDMTTTETTAETTATPMITSPNITIFKNTTGDSNQTSVPSHPTVFPTTGNTTNIQSSNSSSGNTTTNSTAVPTSITTVISHANATTNDSSWITPVSTNTTNSSSAAPTSPTGAATGIPISSNGSSSPQVDPTQKASVTSQGSMAPRQTPTAVLASSSGPSPSRAPAPLPTGVQLLRRVPLSFRIINRSFNESLRDPTSKDYRTLSHTVLTMYEYVFGCASCMGRQTYKGCSELQFSQGSVEVQSVLIFGHGNDTITSTAAEQQLRKSLDHNGFIMDLQLASIRTGTEEVISPAPVPAVPDWAIALLVLVCILLLLSILTCFLMTTCTCRRKSRGKLDLLSTKDSYHPMAEYPPYQSHGRYMSPNSKPNPYSQVAGSNGAGAGTFTYTNPAATSDNL
ncbi:mucin-1 [Numenius arquata]|uniref:mucin-1 n=1 Tax=Numenius arquata TaxID=31919 RepID=UPI003D307EDB